MFITMNNEIICLNNLKKVTAEIGGRGSKATPYYYYIKFEYIGNDFCCVHYEGNKERAEKDFKWLTEQLCKKKDD